jgi:hypothetical protein
MIQARTFHAIALTTVLLTTGAAAQKSEPAAVDYFPLRVNDSWTYRSTSGGTDYKRRVLSEEKQVDGTTRYLVETSMGTRIQVVFSKVKGWVLMHAERYPDQERLEPEYEPAKQYLPNPLVAGSKWQSKGEDPTQPEVQETNQVVGFETLTVPAGQFRAMKVVTRFTGGSPTMTKTCWYADGVGLVKQATEDGQKQSNWELTDYSFKKKGRK